MLVCWRKNPNNDIIRIVAIIPLLGVEEPEEKSYINRETLTVGSKKKVVDREGWAAKNGERNNYTFSCPF